MTAIADITEALLGAGEITINDAREIDGFARFLLASSEAVEAEVNGRTITFLDHWWLGYARGEHGAPPVLWEGDYS